MKKGNIGIQTIFFIMMAIFMVTIILYGYTKINEVRGVLSESERVQVKSDLKQFLEFCEDPLNKGDRSYLNVDLKDVNVICYLGADAGVSGQYALNTDWKILYDSGDDIILLNSEFTGNEENFSLNKYRVIDSINFEFISLETTGCFVDFDQKKGIDLIRTC